jgi:hypothetical protein
MSEPVKPAPKKGQMVEKKDFEELCQMPGMGNSPECKKFFDEQRKKK